MNVNYINGGKPKKMEERGKSPTKFPKF